MLVWCTEMLTWVKKKTVLFFMLDRKRVSIIFSGLPYGNSWISIKFHCNLIDHPAFSGERRQQIQFFNFRSNSQILETLIRTENWWHGRERRREKLFKLHKSCYGMFYYIFSCVDQQLRRPHIFYSSTKDILINAYLFEKTFSGVSHPLSLSLSFFPSFTLHPTTCYSFSYWILVVAL